MKKLILAVLSMALCGSVQSKGVFDHCTDPETGMVNVNKCTENYEHVEPPPYIHEDRNEVVSIRRAGDDHVIVTYGDGSYDDLHRRPNGTWGKGLWVDPSSGTTIAK